MKRPFAPSNVPLIPDRSKKPDMSVKINVLPDSNNSKTDEFNEAKESFDIDRDNSRWAVLLDIQETDKIYL